MLNQSDAVKETAKRCTNQVFAKHLGEKKKFPIESKLLSSNKKQYSGIHQIIHGQNFSCSERAKWEKKVDSEALSAGSIIFQVRISGLLFENRSANKSIISSPQVDKYLISTQVMQGHDKHTVSERYAN